MKTYDIYYVDKNGYSCVVRVTDHSLKDALVSPFSMPEDKWTFTRHKVVSGA